MAFPSWVTKDRIRSGAGEQLAGRLQPGRGPQQMLGVQVSATVLGYVSCRRAEQLPGRGAHQPGDVDALNRAARTSTAVDAGEELVERAGAEIRWPVVVTAHPRHPRFPAPGARRSPDRASGRTRVPYPGRGGLQENRGDARFPSGQPRGPGADRGSCVRVSLAVKRERRRPRARGGSAGRAWRSGSRCGSPPSSGR